MCAIYVNDALPGKRAADKVRPGRSGRPKPVRRRTSIRMGRRAVIWRAIP